jgi:hypothetical protein
MRREELADAAERYIRCCAADDLDRDYYTAEQLDAVVKRSRERFLGVGAEQYQISETEQSFERSTIGTMLVGKIEELVDDLNYAVMLDILISREIGEDGERAAVSPAGLTLLTLRDSLQSQSQASTFSAASSEWLLDALVVAGVYTPKAGKTYVEQLAVEVAEGGA